MPSVTSHTAGETSVSSTDEARPRKPPITAPRVVQSFHSTDISSTKKRALPAHRRGGDIDLRLATLLDDLGLPRRDAHEAINDAVMAGLAFVKLRRLLAKG